MTRRFTFVLALALWGAQSFFLPGLASARTPLTQAVVRQLRNIVELIPEDRPRRRARVSDQMTPGDALSTARESFAELRFNDGSLARLGERVVFRFSPATRTFRLSNGTLLLLVPPGQGRTRIQTPNATAGIRGSALFARYIPGTNTTLIGALTDSGIEVANQDSSERLALEAGQMAVIFEDSIIRVYAFDLGIFYETSELARGLSLADASGVSNVRSGSESDQAIAQVRQETIDAIQRQSPIVGDDIIVNPDFIRLSATLSRDQSGNPLFTPSTDSGLPLSDQIQSIFEAGEIQGPESPFEPPIDNTPSPPDNIPVPVEPTQPPEPVEPIQPIEPPQPPGSPVEPPIGVDNPPNNPPDNPPSNPPDNPPNNPPNVQEPGINVPN
ncbi:MAG TPA: FecR family protein [Elainellaceae cyanobacterium]